MAAVETTAVSERIVELREGRMVTRVLVGGDGPPLLYLHGAGGLFWDPFLEALATRFTVYAPEHPGSGQSVGLEELRDMWDLVLYYNDLLDALSLPDVDVVGHSFGGMVAVELAANNPNRVRRLVLIAPIGLWRDDAPIADIAGIAPERLPELILASILHFIWPIPDKGLSRRIHRVQAPTLLVWGQQDGLVPPVYADEFASRLRSAEISLVDDAGHLPQLEQGDVVRERVLAFLTTTTPT